MGEIFYDLEGGSTRSKTKEKSGQNASQRSNDRFLWKSKPNVGQIISGTKCDKDKPIFFSAERGGQ